MLKIYSIEFTNCCNLKCTYCRTGKVAYPKGFISFDNFSKAIQYTDSFNVHSVGEPLLHPNFLELISIGKQNNKTMDMHTNGILLTPEMSKKIIEINGLVNIQVSVHTKESLVGFKNLFDINQEMGTIANVSGIIMDIHVPVFKEWANYSKIEDKHLARLSFQTMHNWTLNDPHNMNLADKCMFIQEKECVVKWDGKVCACCFDFEGETYLGELDNFPNLVQKPNHNLCERCSSTWVNGGHMGQWATLHNKNLWQ